MQQRFKLLSLLADGNFHSGSELGAALGISRSAVWKHLRTFPDLDIDVHAVRGKGYQLARPVELLDRETILSAMNGRSKKLISGLEIFDEIDSTNNYLMQKAVTGGPSGYVCLAESQQTGRGRHGQKWVSPHACNIYLSVLWNFPLGPDSLAGLGLAVGVGIMRSMREFGIYDAGLKWPNDVVWKGAKLAGILLEMTGTSSSNCCVVIGIGLNVDMSAHASEVIDQPWTNLSTIVGKRISRNVIAASLIRHVLNVVTDFEKHGLSPFLDEWRRYDIVTGKKVTIQLPNSELSGIGQGIDDSGALVIKKDEHLHRFFSGEVRLQVSY